MDLVWIILGSGLVALALADLINTLVTTTTADGRWWPSRILGHGLFRGIRFVAVRLDDESRWRERVLSVFWPVLLLVLLAGWIVLQIVGFALIWFAFNDVAGVESIGDAVYYSGAVIFTVGFGEVLPTTTGPRIGALVEAGCGVITTALVIGYLPSLYGAYSAREQKKSMTIDDGSGDRISTRSVRMIRRSPKAIPCSTTCTRPSKPTDSSCCSTTRPSATSHRCATGGRPTWRRSSTSCCAPVASGVRRARRWMRSGPAPSPTTVSPRSGPRPTVRVRRVRR